eukprot:365325-Chlamydomonas_euryale.AAC.25
MKWFVFLSALRRSGSVYAMTKAAMNQLTKNLACEWAKHNIRVNSVAPWYTATPLAEQVLQDGALKAEVLSHTPLGRIAKPEDVAGERRRQLACTTASRTQRMTKSTTLLRSGMQVSWRSWPAQLEGM